MEEPTRSRARHWFFHIRQKRKLEGRPIRDWEWPILQGVAKRLARSTPEELSAWGRRNLARLGGYTVQRLYRREGRNPTARATHMSKYIRKARKRQREQAEERKRLGLAEPSKHGFCVGSNPFWD